MKHQCIIPEGKVQFNQYHCESVVVGMSLLISVCQSSFLEYINVYRSWNFVLVDCNVKPTGVCTGACRPSLYTRPMSFPITLIPDYTISFCLLTYHFGLKNNKGYYWVGRVLRNKHQRIERRTDS